MSEPKKTLSLVEVINLLGSIASITGVSLLWMRDKLDARTLFLQIPIMAIWAAFVLAITVAGYYGVLFFRGGFESESSKARLAAILFAIPFVAGIVWGLAFMSFQLAYMLIRDVALP